MGTHLQQKPALGKLAGMLFRGLLVLSLPVIAGQFLLCSTSTHAEPNSVIRKSAAVEARRVEVRASPAGTRFTLGLSSGVRAEIFTLADPYRVIIDLPDVAFQLAEGSGEKGAGLISSFRYGLLAEGKARIVIDTTGPVSITSANMQPGIRGVDLTVQIASTSVKSFGGGTGAGHTTFAPKSKASAISPPKVARTRPLVLVDAGHGGIDPGAASATGLKEKTVVLAVALALKERLTKAGRYDVRLTRDSDVFISLDERLRLSREHDADLFISLHADSIAKKARANSVRGATVYTLSEQASDEEARSMAEKENNSDAVAGLQTAKFEEAGEVRNILIDLMKRETSNFSADLSGTLVRQLGTAVSLSNRPQRSAAFKVLRQADTPSVLIELGYMSHPEDEKLLKSAQWQRRVAASIASAIHSYFSKRTAGAR